MIWFVGFLFMLLVGIMVWIYFFDSSDWQALGTWMVVMGLVGSAITGVYQSCGIMYPNPVEYREILSVTKTTNHTAIVTFENPATKTYMTETLDTASIVNATNIYVRVFSGLNGFKREIMPKYDIINGDRLGEISNGK